MAKGTYDCNNLAEDLLLLLRWHHVPIEIDAAPERVSEVLRDCMIVHKDRIAGRSLQAVEPLPSGAGLIVWAALAVAFGVGLALGFVLWH